jgi:hypothetical protein
VQAAVAAPPSPPPTVAVGGGNSSAGLPTLLAPIEAGDASGSEQAAAVARVSIAARRRLLAQFPWEQVPPCRRAGAGLSTCVDDCRLMQLLRKGVSSAGLESSGVRRVAAQKNFRLGAF